MAVSLKLLIKFVIISYLNALINGECNLPSDFWCDHVKIEKECGTERYCATYRKNMRNRPFDIKIFLDGNANDSQNFITEKLYPNLVSHPERATIRLFPVTLNKHSYKPKKCVFDDPECKLNELLSCAIEYLNGEKLHHFVFCVELSIKYNRTAEESEISCGNEIISDNEQQLIRYCMKSSRENGQEAIVEKMARTLKPATYLFLPWISINDKSLAGMQAYQSMLKSKLLTWHKVLNKKTNRSVTRTGSRCMLPPDFWCESTQIVNECFDTSKCALYKRNSNGQRIQLTLLYATHCPFSQATIVDNFYENVWLNKKLRKFFKIKFLPYGNGKVDNDGNVTCQHGLAECVGNTIHDCVQAKTGYEETIEYIVCHMREVRERGNDRSAFEKCSNKLGWSSAKKHSIRKCTNSEEGHKLQLRTAYASENLEPELKHFIPWLVINDYSTLEMQGYIKDLANFLCRWYYGANDARKECNLCEYAPSRCHNNLNTY
ncbi:unnamed protein product [Anisakis simplex]|uniref:Gamma-interferon-inducible lysosomal thiol reductase (inferred by orthology to a human protein) n=1 Tax=Anisakis simplex TaxID=6269 RepID=A0A0M3JVI7_ANISI|nr:unnamed protein product [Anisakis simplex]